ncbi:MAG: hypothetical protein RL702_2623 [Pseudomonadota bacterium]|jgi:hypothetical protein|nr:PepSY domain-containing protein [Novosphingobium sp.]HOA50154.1 PepSY domain-containing protein [Novosphingobium sp.]HPB21730.1 PepSY domain-containing protein [Novosphingobium sp.]HPZ46521.1 PepSY domain-containing protein [Novosphingobium sp.]HQD98796.1 PepSY domain-containing protein [Novosphingobium sp.]
MKKSRAALLAVLPLLTFLAAPAAHADGNVRCNAGPREAWKAIADLRKKAWMEGWTVQKTQIEGDCYEVYARTESGQAIEAFFHPVTLQKLVVYRRGREIYRAPGFSPP